MPRSPLLPHLAKDENISAARAFRAMLAESAVADAHTRAKASLPFKTGDKVRIQGRDGPMLWNRVGEVEVERNRKGNSYFVRTEDDEESLLLRNRRHLKHLEPKTFKMAEEMSPHYTKERKVHFSENVEMVDAEEEKEDEFVTAPSSPAAPEGDAPFKNTRSQCRFTREDVQEFMQAQAKAKMEEAENRFTREDVQEFMQAQAKAKMEEAGNMMEKLMKSRRV